MQNSIEPLQAGLGQDIVVVEFVFEVEPKTSFCAWLQELYQANVLPGPAPKYIGARAGSYIEVMYLSIATLNSVLICLGLIERIVERVTYIRARARVMVSRNLPAAIRRRALEPFEHCNNGNLHIRFRRST